MLLGPHMKKTVSIFAAFVLTFAAPVAAQQSLQQQNDQILQELKAIRQLMEKLAGPLNGQPGGPVPTAAAPVNDNVKFANVTGYVLGRADAPLTMVEFTDLQCPFCRQFHATAFEQIKREYIDTGKLRYISRDFPLDTIHPLAIAASRADRCAGEQGKFWEMRHAILGNGKLKSDSFAGFAKDLKLDVAGFNACVADTARLDARWQSDRAEGV